MNTGQTGSKRTVKRRFEVSEMYLEVESALVFTDVKGIGVISCVRGHTLNLLVLKSRRNKSVIQFTKAFKSFFLIFQNILNVTHLL